MELIINILITTLIIVEIIVVCLVLIEFVKNIKRNKQLSEKLNDLEKKLLNDIQELDNELTAKVESKDISL